MSERNGKKPVVLAGCSVPSCEKVGECEIYMRDLHKDATDWVHVIFCDEHVRSMIANTVKEMEA